MIKVAPYIKTNGSERFKEFLSLPFKIDMLYPVFNENSCPTLFDGWMGKDMLSWHRFINEEKYLLEFYTDYYTIALSVGGNIKYKLKIPKTINDFINDMERFGVPLYWTIWIDENFEPKEYLSADEVETYFLNLLHKMGKYNEML
jgi:hypothetical protein